MSTFDIRLKNGLFPDMPESYTNCVHRALEKVGVKPKRRISIVSVAIAAAAIAASFAVILTGAVLHHQSPQCLSCCV